MTTIRTFEVGGCIRDELLGLRTKDIDFAVEGIPTLDALNDHLTAKGFEVFKVDADTFTVRARFPRTHPQHGRTTADFVLCRKESSASNGRRPDVVEVGTIFDDLARRDFTVNAMARTEAGELLDPHGGLADLDRKLLRAVGDPMTRFREDALRAIRAIRFHITKGFALDGELQAALENPETAELLVARKADGKRVVAAERIGDELDRCFVADTLRTFDVLAALPEAMRLAMFRDGLKLTTTLKGRKEAP